MKDEGLTVRPMISASDVPRARVVGRAPHVAAFLTIRHARPAERAASYPKK
jgi:hypothetical protein